MPLRTFLIIGLAAALAVPLAPAQRGSHTLFANSTDIGPAAHGTTLVDHANDAYTITGGGSDMWGAADAFRMAWQRLDGDATLTATIQFPPGQHPPNEKAVLIFRQSLDPAARYADIAVHADGHITLQWRAVFGGATDDIEAAIHHATRVRIQRVGSRFTAWVAGPDGTMTQVGSAVIGLHDPVYVGLGVCAHDATGLATVTFSHVTLHQDGWTAPAPAAH